MSTDDRNFFHADYTTATSWELFIIYIEEVLCTWNLTGKRKMTPLTSRQLKTGKWCSSLKNITFADTEFEICYHFLKYDKDDIEELDADCQKLNVLQNLMFDGVDFIKTDDIHRRSSQLLCRLYGLKEFITLRAMNSNYACNESIIKQILSSMSIAVTNTNCEVPIFLNILKEWQNLYTGVYISTDVKADYQMIHLRKFPGRYTNISGLLKMFKSKMAESIVNLDPVSVSTRFTYITKDFHIEQPDNTCRTKRISTIRDFNKVPFGVHQEAIGELILYCTFPKLPESLVNDTESYSDFHPNLASYWSLEGKPMDHLETSLAEFTTEFIKTATNKKPMRELIADLMKQKEHNEPDLASSLNLLTGTRVSVFSKIINDIPLTHKLESQGNIPNDILTLLLYFLFPDADPDKNMSYNLDDSNEQFLKDNQKNTKTCPKDSLVWRLSIAIGHVNLEEGGVKAVAHLWYEFKQELRYRWERNILIPGIAPGPPDHKKCLLHQKLQMLNCCINKRRLQDLNKKNEQENVQRHVDEEKDSDIAEELKDDEELFFDCQQELYTESPKKLHSIWNEPVGRLKKCGELKLLKTGEYLYIPVTQEVSPKTEDQLEQDAEILMRFSSDKQGSEMRARLMSASLYSDMESFKAANPGAILEDFIRWYSPRDWIEEDGYDEFNQKKGRLSSRMELPCNTWKEIWETSKPVPSQRQKSLFDHTKEAEMVLHFLDLKNISEIMQLLLPTFIHIVIDELAQQCDKYPSLSLTSTVQLLFNKLMYLSREPIIDPSSYKDIPLSVKNVERVISFYQSLEQKLFPDDVQLAEKEEFLSQVALSKEAIVPNGPKGPVGNRIFIIFSGIIKMNPLSQDNKLLDRNIHHRLKTPKLARFPRATYKEFILRVYASRPFDNSCLLPQKLTATISQEDVFIAACYTQDTEFL